MLIRSTADKLYGWIGIIHNDITYTLDFFSQGRQKITPGVVAILYCYICC